MHARTTNARALAAAACATLLLTACGGVAASPSSGGSEPAAATPTPEPEPDELLVLEWGGYEAPPFWVDFADAHPDTPVDFEFGISDNDILDLMLGGSEADVFHFYTGWQQFYVDAGLVQPIDTSKLTNWDKVPDSFKALGQVDGVQYYVPWDWGFSSILYNTDEVPEVTSWDALFNEDYAGHISMWDDGPAAVSVSSYINGWDETAITEEQLAQIEQDWIAQKPLNLHYWDSEYENLCPEVMSGDIWVAYAWQGCYASALYEGTPVAYANPSEGRNSWVGMYGISSSSDSPELALQFLDAKLADKTCGNAVTRFYYGCVNSDVMDAVDDPVLIEAFAIDNPDILAETNFTPPVTEDQRQAWGSMWTRVKAE